MCCFSRTVAHVASTRIFARGHPDGRQALAYAMRFAADEDLAMLLPLPVPEGTREEDVRFIDLSGAADFFTRLDALFEVERSASMALRGGAPQVRTLAVQRVGAFEASFSPTIADLDRLDPRFRLPAAVLSALDGAGRGFAVFKLAATRSLLGRITGDGTRDVHPMAFTFPRRDPDTLFFPTLHVHDGTAPASADFDHTLYAQLDGRPSAFPGEFELRWQPSNVEMPALAEGSGLVDTDRTVFRTPIRGTHANADVVVTSIARPTAAHVERAARGLLGSDAERALALLAPVQGWAGEDPSEVRLAALWHLEREGGGLRALAAIVKRPWSGLREEAVRPSLTAARRARGGPLPDAETRTLGRADERTFDAFVRRFDAP